MKFRLLNERAVNRRVDDGTPQPAWRGDSCEPAVQPTRKWFAAVSTIDSKSPLQIADTDITGIGMETVAAS